MQAVDRGRAAIFGGAEHGEDSRVTGGGERRPGVRGAGIGFGANKLRAAIPQDECQRAAGGVGDVVAGARWMIHAVAAPAGCAPF